ncbi:MAG TPA: hypothetical protein VK588_14450 [Chitinophagaceae bacterium]|nr:hypothetical protein [Chitinophagaceae bacterium]
MKKVIALLLVYSAFLSVTYAQGPAKAAYVEIGGPGLASANFDMRFANKEGGAGFRVGVGAFPVNGATVVTVPLGLNYLIGKNNKSYFEVGAGFTYLKISAKNHGTSKNFTSSFGNVTLGYRYAPAKGGFFFKAEVTPIFGSGFFLPFAGLGFGYKF